MAADESLQVALTEPRFTPPRAAVPAVLALLDHADEDVATGAERALARLGDIPLLTAAFSSVPASARWRLCAALGRLVRRDGPPELVDFFLERLDVTDSRTARRAATALSKTDDPRVSGALLRVLDDADPPLRRVLVRALGVVGDAEAAERIAKLDAGNDAELARLLAEAQARLARLPHRAVPTVVDGTQPLGASTPVLLHVRAGLEAMLIDELAPLGAAKRAGRGRIRLEHAGTLNALFAARTCLHFAFPFGPVALADDTDATLVTAVAGLLASEPVRALMGRLTVGAPRFRLEWLDGGHRRALSLRVAAAVHAAAIELVNDPAQAPWELAIAVRDTKRGRLLFAELWPRKLVDPRFAYRAEVLPASSHPTIAAALARVAGARPADVVWDPFTGAGTELIERALLGPATQLLGTDLDVRAIRAAERNVAQAGVANVTLQVGDALTTPLPERLDVVLSNPPLGRRVMAKDGAAKLIIGAVERALPRLARGARVVFISPSPAVTARALGAKGLELKFREAVDLGGFDVELQSFVRR